MQNDDVIVLLKVLFPSAMQTLKNALSPYRLGGASGGSDFDPKGKSDNEVAALIC